MARIKGVKNLCIAPVTSNTPELYTAGEVEKIPHLISLSVDTKNDSEDVYSDDIVEETVYGTVMKEGKVVIGYLTPELKAKLLGGEVDNKGVYYEVDGTTPKHFALGFEATTTSGKSKYVWYYDVQFSLETSDEYETAKDKPSIGEVELSFKCYLNKNLKTHVAELDGNGAKADEDLQRTFLATVPTSKNRE